MVLLEYAIISVGPTPLAPHISSSGISRIRAARINPGLTLTPDWIKTAKQLTESTGGDWEGYLDGVAREHAAIKRFGTPQELANTFVFLCSDRAAYTVGSTYFVDGGMLKTL